jgi:membrane dipeptidase
MTRERWRALNGNDARIDATGSGAMRLKWQDLGSARADAADGATVEIAGFAVSALPLGLAGRFILAAEPGCCPGCFPRDVSASVEVLAAAPMPIRGRSMRLTGTLRIRTEDPDGWRYQLHGARLLDPPGWTSVTRRSVLAAGPLMCLAACANANTPETVAQRQTDGRLAIESSPSVDIHSHAGHLTGMGRVRGGAAFVPVAEPMRKGGMAVICHAVVADSPCTHLEDKVRIRSYRTPDPGELYQYSQLSFARLHQLVREQGLTLIKTAAGLRAAKAGTPSSIIASEGADWLEGNVDRVDEAREKWSLRHLQLTHYRVNELGDIQTEAPVHGGLSDFGAEVIRRCNRIGMVVDVAHGPYDLVKRAASVTTKPLILSHTALTDTPRPYTRHITRDHARVVASTGGVIGVWPPTTDYISLTAMATGMAKLVDVVGVDHVGLGSDMEGLLAPSAFPDYEHLPELAEALFEVGFNTTDATKILGGNYVRVFEASVG